MDDGLQSAADLLTVVVTVVGIVVNSFLAVFVYRLTKKDESGRLEAVLEADRQARQEIFEHERELQREERRAAAFKGYAQSLEEFRLAAQKPIWNIDARDAFTEAVDSFFYGLGPIAVLMEAPAALREVSDVLIVASEWSISSETSTAWGKLNEQRIEILGAVIQARSAIHETWFDKYAERRPVAFRKVEARDGNGSRGLQATRRRDRDKSPGPPQG